MIPKKLLEEIELWMQEKRYGNLQINFSGGKIINFNRLQSVKMECLGAIESASAVLESEVKLDPPC